MKKINLFIAIIFFASQIKAQINLVPNPSFEDTINLFPPCEIENSMFWHSYKGTPDYYNPNATIMDCLSPKNLFGYQKAYVGNSYFGIITYPTIISEAIYSKLKNPLQVGVKYYISFWISLSDSSTFASNNLSIAFSVDSNIIHPTVKLCESNIISNFKNWVEIKTSFISDSLYHFIYIGNFYDDFQTDTMQVNLSQSVYNTAYYYIDNLCLSTDSLECNSNTSVLGLQSTPSLVTIKNPAIQILEINSSLIEAYCISIFNIQGVRNINLDSMNEKRLEINISSLPKGIYFLKINSANYSQVIKFINQ